MTAIPLELLDLPVWYLRAIRKGALAGSVDEMEDRVSPHSLMLLKYPYPTEFLNYHETTKILRAHPDIFLGLGIYLANDLSAVILRNCVGPDGSLADWALPWISSFRSYWQFTPDKQSALCVFRAERSYGSGVFKLGDAFFELLDPGSFCAMSDQPLTESEDILGWCEISLRDILEQASGRAEESDVGAERVVEVELLPVLASSSGPDDSDSQGDSGDPQEQPTGRIALRSIVINGRQLRDVITDVNEAVLAANRPPVLFSHNGILSEIRDLHDGSNEVVPITSAALLFYASLAADFYRALKDGTLVGCSPIQELISSLLGLPADKLGFPRLKGVVNTPLHRPDGTLITVSGYDAVSRLYYRPRPGIEGIEIPEKPTRDDVARSRDKLLDLVVDFRFTEASDRANFFGALLTPALRPTIDGNIPMFCVKAQRPDSGKTTLCDITGFIYQGTSLARNNAPKPRSLEWEKRLFSLARINLPFVLFDNVEHEVESDYLAQALTSPTSRSRILGESQTQLVFNRSMFIANGNSEFTVGLNIKRRCYWSNLEPHDAALGRKADQSPWVHSPFDRFLKKHRRDLLQAILTLTRAWFWAECPSPRTPTIDSFEEWSRIVGGVLQHAEIPDFLANYDKMVLEGDPADAEWEAFLQATRWIMGFEVFTTREFVLRIQWSDAIRAVLPEDLQVEVQKGNATAVGKAMYKHSGIPYGESRIKLTRVGPNRDKVMTWKIESPQAESSAAS